MNQLQNVPTRQLLETRIKSARTSVYLIAILTAINVLLVMLDVDITFSFSAGVPYLISFIPYFLWDAPTFGQMFIFALIGLVLLVPYLLAGIFSKKHPGWMIFTLIYFSLDFVVTLIFFLGFLEFGLSTVLIIAFHLWALISIISGISANAKLKNLPEEDVQCGNFGGNFGGDFFSQRTVKFDSETGEEIKNPVADSEILRPAGTDEKVKIYLQTKAGPHEIIYRKYGSHCEELVVDGNVLAEQIFSGAAKPHTMTAYFDGACIKAGYFNRNFIILNEREIASSVRWF